jgi:hypothetical protein
VAKAPAIPASSPNYEAIATLTILPLVSPVLRTYIQYFRAIGNPNTTADTFLEALLRIGMQNPACRDVLAGKAIEPRSVERVSLTSAQQSVPPCAADLAAETVQSQQVRRNCMARKKARDYH